MSHRNPPRTRLARWAGLGVWALMLSGPLAGFAQVGPEESARKIKPADGLHATLWASEPLVNNPTNMDVDSRGRVWVTEGLNYRLQRARNAGLKKIEEADRIKILEDTDGDGKADKVTVFADHIFPVPMGLAVEERYGKDGKYKGCKVYIGNSPDLLVLEDTDGDDKADKRYPLLTGFGGVDSDHGVHGMVLGLDGKLYFTHGDGCCSVQQDHTEKVQNFDVVDKSGRHVSSDQLANTLRVNRDGTQFEVLADRQRNNYETSLNAFGNIFTSDNDDDGNRGSRVIWVMDGGQYGYRTPGSPRHWGEEVPGSVPKLAGTGNGSPCGIMVYEGSLFPKEYHGAVLEADAGTRQINFFPLSRHGASFRTEYKVFLGSDDPWFRPVDMTAAPDGAVFVADWYDAGVGGHAFKDQDTGRIYRVTPIGAKPKAAKPNFGTVHGLIEALRSPVVAAQDAARRGLIEYAKAGDPNAKPVDPEKPKGTQVLDPEQEAVSALVNLFSTGQPHERARTLWVLHAIVGDRAAEDALKDRDPRIREQAVRILGRDARENGRVEYKDPAAKLPAPASTHLKALLPMAADPDAGVRRELVLALRNLPTEQVGDALKTLARTWDGQDRWYLEALGLALEARESDFLESLFDGTLYGDLTLDDTRQVALPPYFPVDRNEAYIVVGTKDLPASGLSKTLGLAWRIHQPAVLPLLARIAPKLDTPELQQAADDVVMQINDPAGAEALAGLAAESNDPTRKRQVLELLGRKLGGNWAAARANPRVIQVIQLALGDPLTRSSAMVAAAATGDGRFADEIRAEASNPKASEEVRVAAVEALGQLNPPKVGEFFDKLIAETKGKNHSNSPAEAAVRTLPKLGNANRRLADLIVAKDYPLGLRREALRTFARTSEGGRGVLALAREDKLPADLRTEATTVVNAHVDGKIRDEASKILPLPKTKSGRPLPPFGDLIRRDGRADVGRDVFFRGQEGQGLVSCGGCHRVQGRGDWVGPDLSTIGTKYGKDELLRSILNPSAAIGYNYKTAVVATKDGQVFTGLPVEDGPDRLVLKTADAKRIAIRPGDVDDRSTSDVSLMPEGLAETMGDQDLVDLLAFLTTLRQPVSIVGQYQVIGPLANAKDGSSPFDTSVKVNLRETLTGPEGRKLSWRRLNANAEGRADLSTLAGADPKQVVYLHAPVGSPVEQDAQLVLETKGDLKVWFNGKELELPQSQENEPRSVFVRLPKGSSDLLIRAAGNPNAALVTTLVADRPVEFSVEESKDASR
ncbi:PVC-type heme-binding CxxCH protein [Singulisphaera sp. Ch08]|uniref:PVC-type heme-binding CxxCH protein n=1 Tax=Singulisphaera sp. Ch08 TaxID=3120278 RepID=A0AAU7CHA9_9BACT